MKLTLQRKPKNGNALAGVLLTNGSFECYTMENAALAVPAGTYALELYDSPAHGKDTPQLKAVPGRSNCQIHKANWPYELKGCIAPGQASGTGCVEHSQAACDTLLPKIRTAIHNGEETTITILDA